MNNYTLKITPLEAQKAEDFFKKSGASFDIVQNALWRAKLSSYQAVYYKSGRLLLQGSDVSAAADALCSLLSINQDGIEKKSAIHTVQHTEKLINTNGENYIGTDESGKGDFFGPLVIAGVQSNDVLNKKFREAGIKDSKKLDDEKILKLAAFIKANALHSVIVIMPKKYNELYSKFKNLNKLLAWGHAQAVENIIEKSPCRYALADKFGDESLIENALKSKGINIILKQCPRAEADTAPAAASVLARAEFVKRMQELSRRYEMPFSKGVSPDVIHQAEEFIKKYSYNRLNETAKMHFKTASELNRL